MQRLSVAGLTYIAHNGTLCPTRSPRCLTLRHAPSTCLDEQPKRLPARRARRGRLLCHVCQLDPRHPLRLVSVLCDRQHEQREYDDASVGCAHRHHLWCAEPHRSVRDDIRRVEQRRDRVARGAGLLAADHGGAQCDGDVHSRRGVDGAIVRRARRDTTRAASDCCSVVWPSVSLEAGGLCYFCVLLWPGILWNVTTNGRMVLYSHRMSHMIPAYTSPASIIQGPISML